MSSWIVYKTATGQIVYHNFIGSEQSVQKTCRVNPGTTYMKGQCKPRHCKVDVTTTPHTVLHNQDLEPIQAWMRQRRNIMLKACDWTQGADSPLSESKKAEWRTYRQALRDITSTYPNPSTKDDVIWPTTP